LKIPAIGILVAGIVNLLAALSIVLIPVVFPVSVADLEEPSARKIITLLIGVGAIVSLVLGIIMLLGAARMFDLQNWGIAGIAAFGAILPLSPGFPISLLFGIWALVVLSRQDVRTAFADWDAESERDRTNVATSAVGWAMSVGMIVGLTLGAALARNNIGVYLVLGMILGLLVGCVIESNNRRKSQD
jgi:hypothetical protein